MPTGVYERTKEYGKIMSKAKMGNIDALKGGIIKDGNGYFRFKVLKGCKFSCMGDHQRYIPIHRLIMADYLDRPLTSEEIVHHEKLKKEEN